MSRRLSPCSTILRRRSRIYARHGPISSESLVPALVLLAVRRPAGQPRCDKQISRYESLSFSLCVRNETTQKTQSRDGKPLESLCPDRPTDRRASYRFVLAFCRESHTLARHDGYVLCLIPAVRDIFVRRANSFADRVLTSPRPPQFYARLTSRPLWMCVCVRVPVYVCTS